MYRDMLHVCGIDKLMETMISLLADKMIVEIPVLVQQMKAKKVEVYVCGDGQFSVFVLRTAIRNTMQLYCIMQYKTM